MTWSGSHDYAHEMLMLAICDMAVSTKSLRHRVGAAYENHLFKLHERTLPPDEWKQFKEMRDYFSADGRKYPYQLMTIVEFNRAFMTAQLAKRFSRLICSLACAMSDPVVAEGAV